MKFNILDLFKYYFKNYILAGIIFIIVVILGTIYISCGYKKEYVAKTTVMLGVCIHDCGEESHLDVNLNKAVVNDYMELIKSASVLDKANKNTRKKYSTADLKGMVNTYFTDSTEYITIEVTSNNKGDSARLSYNIYDALTKEVYRIFGLNNIHLVDSDANGSIKVNMSYLFILIIILALFMSFVATTIKFLFFKDVDILSYFNKKTTSKKPSRKRNKK